MKKVAIVANSAWNLYNFRLNLAKAIENFGYRVIFIAPYDKYTQLLKEEGFKIYDIKINPRGTNPLQDNETLINFKKLYQKINPTIILHYTIKPIIYGTIAAKSYNIPVINTITGLGSALMANNLITNITKKLYKFSLSKSFKVFFQNQDDMNFFITNKIVEKYKCILVAGSGIDINRFAPIKPLNKNSNFSFLLIARMIKDKGIYEYIEAAKILKSKYKNIEFNILGFFDNSNNGSIPKEEIIKYHKKKIINYLGTSDYVQEYIAKSECIVLPSYREGISRVLLEAASMAKPIITTNTTGCKDVVDDGITGFLCKVKDYKDLALKCEKMLLISKEERDKFGQNGRDKIIKNFSENLVIDKYLSSIYQASPSFYKFKIKNGHFETL